MCHVSDTEKVRNDLTQLHSLVPNLRSLRIFYNPYVRIEGGERIFFSSPNLSFPKHGEDLMKMVLEGIEEKFNGLQLLIFTFSSPDDVYDYMRYE